MEDSGTTVATVLVKGDLMLVAGLGDSRVVMGMTEEGVLAAQALTLDQSPVVPGERKRIEAAGGEVCHPLPFQIPHWPVVESVWLTLRPRLRLSACSVHLKFRGKGGLVFTDTCTP